MIHKPDHPENQLAPAACPWFAAFCVLQLSICVCAQAGVVQTRTDRLTGPLSFTQSAVKVADKSVPYDQALIIVTDPVGQTISDSNVVHLTSGESWTLDIRKLTGKKLHVQSTLIGDRDIDTAAVRAVDFIAGLPLTEKADAGTLYRELGEPLPGSLLWVDPTRIAIDSPLGALTLSREGALRYVFKADVKSQTATPAPPQDEITLIDGSLFKGKSTASEGHIELEHPLLGKIIIPAKAVRTVVRHVAGVTYISGFPSDAIKLTPLVASTMPAPRIDLRPDAATAITIEPTTTIRYKLPPHGSALSFHAALTAGSNAHGQARVKLQAADKTLFEAITKPGEPPQTIACDVPANDDLIIDVEFTKTVAFPCTITLLDPLLIEP